MRLKIFLHEILIQSALKFFRQRYSLRCSALTFTSLLSFVPLISVLVALFSKLPFAKDQLPKLQHFIFQSFLPDQGEKVFSYVQQFTQEAGRLPWTQFIFLIFTSGSLIFSVAHTLNHVWGDDKKQRALRNLLLSWTVIFFSIVFAGMSLLLSAYLLSLPLLQRFFIESVIHEYLSWCLPWFSSFIGFLILYIVMPRQKIALQHALIGAGVASVLFEIVKQGFAYYLYTAPSYNAIYGTLGVIPLFMIWVYVFWCIVVYGALVTAHLKKRVSTSSETE